MAKITSPVETVKEFWNSEVMDEERWAQNSVIPVFPVVLQ